MHYNLQEYEKEFKFDVLVHDLVDYVRPGFSKSWMNKAQDRRVQSFKSYQTWEKKILQIKRKYGISNILIINEVKILNFKTIKVSLLIKKNNFKTLKFLRTEPFDQSYKFNYYFLLNMNIKKILLFLEQRISNYIGSKLKLFPKYIVTNGIINPGLNVLKKSIVIQGNSRDYNMYLSFFKKKKKKKKVIKYGLFLESPTPLFSGDSFISGTKIDERGDKKRWILSLNKFFSSIERYKKLKIKILPHPKVKHSSNYPSYYFGREVLSKKIAEASENAKFFISRDSTGLSFATIYKKPAIIITSSDLLKKKNNFFERQKNYAKKFGLEVTNIDKSLSLEKLNKTLSFNKATYTIFLKNYLTARKDKKQNYELIGKLI